MYSILIVDDEQIERNGIKMLINKYGMELNIYEAENGKKALEFIEKNPVDILFTDIKMPFMDGLELAENAKKLIPDLKIIIYSAYSEFDYARQAINIKVVHYVLKPIKKDEFIKVMESVLESCRIEEKEREERNRIIAGYQKGVRYEKEKILSELINGIKATGDFQERLAFAGLDISGQYIHTVLLHFKNKFYDTYDDFFIGLVKDIIKHKYEYLNIDERLSLILIITPEPIKNEDLLDIGKRLQNAVHDKFNRDISIIFSEAVSDYTLVSSEYSNMEHVLDYGLTIGDNMIIFSRKDFLQHIPLFYAGGSTDDSNKKVIGKVVDLVKENYMKDVSVEWIAKNVYLSPNYLSYLFKKETGQSLCKYITGVRLSNAEKLLRDTNMKIVNISEMLGYANVSYFCRMFKSFYGLSPQEYRAGVECCGKNS